MAEILEFNLSVQKYLELAESAYQDSNIEKSVRYLKKALELDCENIEAMVFLASIYSSINAKSIANKYLLRAYAKTDDSKYRFNVVTELVKNCCELGRVDVAEYYLSTLGNNMQNDALAEANLEIEEIDESEFEMQQNPAFSLVHPKPDEYYYNLLDEAHQLVEKKDIDKALKLLEQFKEKNKFKNTANHLRLVCLILKEDIDKVIVEAQEMLKEDDYLPIKCVLITAFMVDEKNDEALALLEQVLESKYDNIDELSVVLPILVNYRKHNEVEEFSSKVLRLSKFQPQTMMWLSQAQYNLGKVDQAKFTMQKIATIFGETEITKYYMKIFSEKPEMVDYCLGLPVAEMMDRQLKIKDLLSKSDGKLVDSLTYDTNFQNFVRWAFEDLNGKPLAAIAYTLNDNWCDFVEELYRKVLVEKEKEFNVIDAMLLGFVENKSDIDMFVTIDGKCKNLKMRIPQAVSKLPSIYGFAFVNAVLENMSNIDEMSDNLDFLTEFIESFATVEDDKLVWKIEKGDQASRFKSAKTLLAIFVYVSAFEEQSDIPSICKFYNIKINTFQKYLKILQGENNDW